METLPPGGEDEYFSVKGTADGGAILAGQHRLAGCDEGGLLTKLAADGGVEWKQNYKDNVRVLRDVLPLEDGGYLAIGGGAGPVVLRVDSGGAPLWQKSLKKGPGEPYSLPPDLTGVAPAADGGYLAMGPTGDYYQPSLIVKLSPGGDPLWSRWISHRAESIAAAPSGPFWVSGTMNCSIGNSSTWIARFSPDGDLQCAKATGERGCCPPSLAALPDDGVVMAHGCPLAGSDYRTVVRRIDAGCNLIESFSFHPSLNITQVFCLPVDNRILIAQSNENGPDVVLSILPGYSGPMRQLIYGGPENEELRSVHCGPGGELFLNARRQDPVTNHKTPWILKLDDSGGLGSLCPFIREAASEAVAGPLAPLAGDCLPKVQTGSVIAGPARPQASPMEGSAAMECGDRCKVICGAYASPGFGQPPLEVHFVGDVAVGDCQSSPSVLWDFGDGGTSDQMAASHTYGNSGAYRWNFLAQVDGETCIQSGVIQVGPGQGATWARSFSSWGSDETTIAAVTADGGILLGGVSDDYEGRSDHLLMLDASGNVRWRKRSRSLMGYLAAIPAAGGGAVCAATWGNYSRFMSVVRLEGDGAVMWAKRFSGVNFPCAGVESPDSGAYFAGVGVSADPYYFPWVLKMTGDGDLEWAYLLLGEGLGFTSAALSSRGDLLLGGVNGGGSPLLVRMSPKGKVRWQKEFVNFNLARITGVLPTDADGCVVAMRHRLGFSLAQVDSKGKLTWLRSFFCGGSMDHPRLVRIADGGYALVGTNYDNGGDTILVGLGPDGQLRWQKRVQGVHSLKLLSAPGGGLVAVGTTVGNYIDTGDYWVLKITSEGDTSGSCPIVSEVEINPLEDSLTLKKAKNQRVKACIVVTPFDCPLDDSIPTSKELCPLFPETR